MGQSRYYYNLTWYVTDTQTFCAWNTLSVSKQACLKVKEFNSSFWKKEITFSFYFLPFPLVFLLPIVSEPVDTLAGGQQWLSAEIKNWIKTLELSAGKNVVLYVWMGLSKGVTSFWEGLRDVSMHSNRWLMLGSVEVICLSSFFFLSGFYFPLLQGIDVLTLWTLPKAR